MHVYTAPVVVPVAGEPIHEGAVGVDDGRIAYVGPAADAPEAEATTAFDGVLTPGLVNAHTHLCYTAFADMYGNEKEFFEWIQDFARRNPETADDAWKASVQLGIDESIAHGVTAVADIVTPAAGFEPLFASDLAGVAYWEACFIDDAAWEVRRSAWREVVTDSRAVNHSDVAVGISPHTLYTLGTNVAKSLAELARTLDIRLHPHLAETLHEDMFVRRGSGPFAFMNRRGGLDLELADGGAGHSPAAQMEKVGWLGADSHVAHGVHIDKADREILRNLGTAVALCARSNVRLESGEAPVAALRAEGNAVAIGTDSRASSPDLDVAAEWPVLRKLALAQGDSGEGLNEWLVRAATEGGAKALGREDIGALAVGNRADFAVFDVDTDGDPYAALVNGAAGNCTATVLKGKLIER
ncbi:amidohydrolase family protein [Glycomyces sp. TRM65418]|uniref:amidohydrolase family protein n=1 Tax=Glycomyces sp. TRM65418 TaxID=2867006 RepID=UPI001CE4CCE6|nr:amidohydrolase family protein [Glycomyces sp. TRM65418]MCC3763634.1 amidohydrolase family protein [Glycomyces sp. TRM65418]QZD57617.1 amidohydrolase family protein [Glycomyces sp. TRM65418]